MTIKAKLTRDDGRTYFVLGLSDIEIKQLKEGRPLGFQMEQFGFEGAPHVVVLMHNNTYDAVKTDITKIEVNSVGMLFNKRTVVQ